MRRRHYQIETARTTLAQVQGVWPTDAAVAVALALGEDQVRRCDQRTSLASVSLEMLTEEWAAGFGRSGLEALADQDPAGDPAAVADRRGLRQLLAAALARLPERERMVVLAVYGEGVPQWVVAQRLGVSEARVSQLRTRALQWLRAEISQALEPPATVQQAA
jgi:RNA polymerase sigma factor for flagellar operon FliA